MMAVKNYIPIYFRKGLNPSNRKEAKK